jgi:hypothetical protein
MSEHSTFATNIRRGSKTASMFSEGLDASPSALVDSIRDIVIRLDTSPVGTRRAALFKGRFVGVACVSSDSHPGSHCNTRSKTH